MTAFSSAVHNGRLVIGRPAVQFLAEVERCLTFKAAACGEESSTRTGAATGTLYRSVRRRRYGWARLGHLGLRRARWVGG